MGLDYTVVVNVRAQFGAQDIDVGVYAGAEKTWTFDCPGVAHDHALLLFQSRDVDLPVNKIDINGHVVYGDLPMTSEISGPPRTGGVLGGEVPEHTHRLYASEENVDPFWPFGGWTGNVLLITPGTLRDTGNEFHIEMARGAFGIPWDTVIVDNVVVIYKTR